MDEDQEHNEYESQSLWKFICSPDGLSAAGFVLLALITFIASVIGLVNSDN